MARIFLSHASADKPVVRRIAEALRAAGHDPWLDDDQILVGESIPAAVDSVVKTRCSVETRTDFRQGGIDIA